MKVGIEVQIDVLKIVKARLFKGKKGTYLNLTSFIDTQNKDQYENSGFISHAQTKEEREAKINTPILGNVKVFWTDDSTQQQAPSPEVNQISNDPDGFADDDDIPF